MRFGKILWTVLLVFICGILADQLIWAHVAIFPRTFQAGSRHDAFYIRAPVEKDIPVVELGVEVEENWRSNGGEVADFEEIPGWNQHVELDEKGKIKKAYWQVVPGNSGTVPTTFQMIWARVSMPNEPGEYRFPAWQKYADGSVVRWNETRGEGQEADNPAPIVVITPKAAATTSLNPGSFQMTGLLSVLALAMALAALVVAVRSHRRSKLSG